MFNVSVLLLDDALKPATPLTNGANFLGHPVCVSLYKGAENAKTETPHVSSQVLVQTAATSSAPASRNNFIGAF